MDLEVSVSGSSLAERIEAKVRQLTHGRIRNLVVQESPRTGDRQRTGAVAACEATRPPWGAGAVIRRPILREDHDRLIAIRSRTSHPLRPSFP